MILPVWVFFLLKDRVALTASSTGRCRRRGDSTSGRCSGPSSASSASGSAASCSSASRSGSSTFIGLIILSQPVDPVFGRYAVLLSVIAGILELVPIIGPIIAAVPAVLLAATAGLELRSSPRSSCTPLVQQVENNFLVPKIQGDATELHPAASSSRSSSAASLAGLLGAILALPVTAAFRDVVRYLFRRLSPDEPEAAADRSIGLGLDRHPGSGARRPMRP